MAVKGIFGDMHGRVTRLMKLLQLLLSKEIQMQLSKPARVAVWVELHGYWIAMLRLWVRVPTPPGIL